jgi:hypothetical protein
VKFCPQISRRGGTGSTPNPLPVLFAHKVSYNIIPAKANIQQARSGIF